MTARAVRAAGRLLRLRLWSLYYLVMEWNPLLYQECTLGPDCELYYSELKSLP